MLLTSRRAVVLALAVLSLSSAHADSTAPLIVGRWTFVDILDNGLLPKEELQKRRQVSKALTATFEEGGRYLFFDQPMGTWTLDPGGKRVMVKVDRPGTPPGTTQEMLIQSIDQKEMVIVVGQLPHRMARFVPAAKPVSPPPAPRELSVFEKVAPTKLEPVKDEARRPASAYLHGLWLGSERVSAAAEKWGTPRTSSGVYLDWGANFAAPCDVYEALKSERGVGWPVVRFACGPSAGERASIDVYETYTTREAVSPGVVRETTWRTKVRTDEFTYEAKDAAVTIVVRAPLADRDLTIGVTRVVPNFNGGTRVADGSMFAFTLRGRGYDLVRDLNDAYHKEADRLADAWRLEAEQTKDEDEREEALARFALLKPKEAEVAVEYFKRKYGLSGVELQKLRK